MNALDFLDFILEKHHGDFEREEEYGEEDFGWRREIVSSLPDSCEWIDDVDKYSRLQPLPRLGKISQGKPTVGALANRHYQGGEPKPGRAELKIFTWALAAISLIGVILNIHKDPFCFWVWAGTNFCWAIVDWWKGIYAQAALFIIYFCLAVWGIFAWK